MTPSASRRGRRALLAAVRAHEELGAAIGRAACTRASSTRRHRRRSGRGRAPRRASSAAFERPSGGLEVRVLGARGKQQAELSSSRGPSRAERNIVVKGEQVNEPSGVSRSQRIDARASRGARRDAAVLQRALRQSVERARLRARGARAASDRRASGSRSFLRVAPEEIVFTSGGHRVGQLGGKGLALARGRGHLITSQIEHHAVLRAGQCARERRASRLTYLDVDGTAWSIPTTVRRAIRPDTIGISIMHANSEIGTIQPDRGDRPHRPRARHPVPRGRGADLRQAADRPRRARHRHAVVLGPQDLRPQGHRRALRPQGHQDGLRPARWRARAAPAGRAPRTCPASSGFGKAVEVRGRRHGGGAARGDRRCAIGCGRASGARVPDVRLNGHPDRAAARNREHAASAGWSRNPSCSDWT